MTSAVNYTSFDCGDPFALGTFWAQVLGGRVQDEGAPGDPAVLVTHAGPPLLFGLVPDAAPTRNRVHLDLEPDASSEQEVARAVALGARVLPDRTHPDGTGWVVLADPEGNEFRIGPSASERGEPAPVDTGERAMPAIHAAAEPAMLTGMLDWYRAGVLSKVEGMGQRAATTSPLRTGTTAAGLVKHLALVEDSWFTHGLARRPEPAPWAQAPFQDDPDWEFHSANEQPLADSIALYRAACDRSRAVTADHSLDDTAVNARGRTFSLRFVLLHLVEETARHLGHLDLLRELADGRTGD